MNEDLARFGHTGPVGRIGKNDQQKNGHRTIMPLVFQPGEAFQYDRIEDFAILYRDIIKLQIAQIDKMYCQAFLPLTNLSIAET